MPNIRYETIQDCIEAMSMPTTFVGELEILATASVIVRPVFVYNMAGNIIAKYGNEYDLEAPICAVYTPHPNDSGHYFFLTMHQA